MGSLSSMILHPIFRRKRFSEGASPDKRDSRKLENRQFPHSDKTSCALGAPPSMKMGAAPYRAVNGLFSVGVEAIFIAADLSGVIREKCG
jgi:hypothetical protein